MKWGVGGGGLILWDGQGRPHWEDSIWAKRARHADIWEKLCRKKEKQVQRPWGESMCHIFKECEEVGWLGVKKWKSGREQAFQVMKDLVGHYKEFVFSFWSVSHCRVSPFPPSHPFSPSFSLSLSFLFFFLLCF